MKGRHTSFQRFGRIFGMPGSITNKYPCSIDETIKKQIYDETKDEYKYFDNYDTLSDEDKTKGKYDCHDNYGTMTKGISKWLDENPREKKQDIEQFDPINAHPRKWVDKNKKENNDYTPIPQENIPLVVEGNHEETLGKLSDGIIKDIVQIDAGPGFQETHPNRPIIRQDNDTEFRNDPELCLPLKIPVEDLHTILSCTKEIDVTCSISIGISGIAAKAAGYADVIVKQNCLINECPLHCEENQQQVKFSCCNQSGEVLNLSISSNKSKATLKRFKEYSDLTSKKPVELDLSRNLFQETRTYILTKTTDCDAWSSKYADRTLPSPQCKVLQIAQPKTKLDAGCLTTPLTHGKYNSFKFSKDDILSTEFTSKECLSGSSSIYRYQYPPISSIPMGGDTWDNTGGYLYPSSSPYIGGPSIAFRISENQGNAIAPGFDDKRIILNPEETGKWYDILVESSCVYEDGKTINGTKLNDKLFDAADYKERFLSVEAGGTCISQVFGNTFCGDSHYPSCSEGVFDYCNGNWTDRTCGCPDKPSCEPLVYEKNYGTICQGSRLPTEDIVCIQDPCCNFDGKLPSDVAHAFVASLTFSGHLGRFVRVQPDEGTSFGKTLPIPIPDSLNNKDDVNASFFYSLRVDSDTNDAWQFYFTRAAADKAKGEDDSHGAWSVKECGDITFKHKNWDYKTSVWAPIYERYGSTITYTLSSSDKNTIGACGQLTICKEKDIPYDRPCDCGADASEGPPCREGSQPAKVCGCETLSAEGAHEAKNYSKQLICQNGWSGGSDGDLCGGGGGCEGCYEYKSGKDQNCSTPPCCASSEKNPCECQSTPVCDNPDPSIVYLECPDMGALKTEYTELEVNITIEFKDFEEMEY